MSTENDKVTKPTIETVLERINSLEDRINAKFDGVNARLEELDIKLDRVGSVSHSTRGEMLEMRADFRELNKRLQEHFPALP